jgi:multidrug efflux pump subunit AcrA (membrane-fusion protein)
MESQQVKQKRIIKISCVFLTIILICSFFSKTLSKLMLTRVSIALPKSEVIVKEASGEGTSEFKNTYKLFSPSGTTVLKVYVNKGDQVKKGQKLCLLDLSVLKNEISQLDIKKAKSEEVLKELEGKKQNSQCLKQELEEVLKTHQKTAVLLELEQKIRQNDDKIKKAETLLEVNQELFAQTLISQDEFDETVQKLKSLKDEKEKFILEKQDKQKENERQLTTYQNEMNTLEAQIETEKLNQKELALESDLKLKLMGKTGEIAAKEDGVITDLKLEEGASVNQGQVLLSIGCYQQGYQVHITLDEDVDFIKAGDEAELDIPSHKKFNIKGKIEVITKKENEQEICVSFNANDLQSGETIKFKIKKDLGNFDIVIPYSAVGKEKLNRFVFVVKKIDNPLGEAYVIQKKLIYVQASNGEKAAVSEGLDFLEPVVIASDKEIKDGEKVNVENENDILRQNKP